MVQNPIQVTAILLVAFGMIALITSTVSLTSGSYSTPGLRSAQLSDNQNSASILYNSLSKVWNLSANPCEQPWEYVCGGWISNFTLSAQDPTYSLYTNGIMDNNRKILQKILDDGSCDLQRQIKNESEAWDLSLSCFYKGCQDEKLIDSESIPAFLE